MSARLLAGCHLLFFTGCLDKLLLGLVENDGCVERILVVLGDQSSKDDDEAVLSMVVVTLLNEARRTGPVFRTWTPTRLSDC